MAQDNYTRRFEKYLEISRKLSACVELESFLQELARSATVLVDADESSILVYHEGSRSLRFIAGPWYEFDLMEPIPIPINHSIAGWVYTHTQPIILDEAHQDERVFHAVDRVLNFETGSLIAVPLVYKSQPLGVLESVSQKRLHRFTEDDAGYLELLAFQASVVIRNAQMLKKSQMECQEAIERDRLKTDMLLKLLNEMHTPLSQILAYVSLVREKASADQAADVEAISANAEALKAMLESISDPEDIALKLTRQRRRKGR